MDRARLILAGQLSQLQAIAGPQLTDAQKQLDATNSVLKNAQSQLDTLRGINTSTMSVADAVEALQVALTGEKTARQVAADAAAAKNSGSGGSTDTRSDSEVMGWGIAAQVLGFSASGLTSEQLNAIGARAKDDFSVEYSHSDLGFGNQYSVNEDAARLQFARDTIANGSEAQKAIAQGWLDLQSMQEYSAERMAAAIQQNNLMAYGSIHGPVVDTYNGKNWAQDHYADGTLVSASPKLPGFAVGTNYVPRDMDARIHEGEAIVPAAFNPAKFSGALGGGMSTERFEKLVEGLTEEVKKLKTELANISTNTRRTATAVNGNPDQPILVELA
jgi:hypothetical protein